jgi:crotonobetainyl-CoA:carnitine CoA-transferase CaiB-like acyl-CoA transferase
MKPLTGMNAVTLATNLPGPLAAARLAALGAAVTKIEPPAETALSQGLAHERRNFFLLVNTEDMREGISAFVEKRNLPMPGAEPRRRT